ncbi:MAG: structural constituent of ribosome [Chaenotheca gracillima]|nr:MAG: structural constituent of ribosome [Chaenotheca gracillima]
MDLDSDDILLSSPDPLGGSPTTTTPLSASKGGSSRGRRTKTSSRALASHNSDQTFTLQDFTLSTPPTGKRAQRSSPTKSSAQAENLLSPWRIRVTVEAQREEAEQEEVAQRGKGSSSPSKRKSLDPRSYTTTVPLKGLETNSSPTKKRGRPRKSEQTPRRDSTPSARRGRLPKAVTGATEDGEATTKGQRKRGRPRGKGNADGLEDLVPEEQEPSVDELEGPASDLPRKSTILADKKGKGKRKAISPIKIAMDPDTNSADPASSADETLLDREEPGRALGNLDLNREASARRSVSPAENHPGSSPDEPEEDALENQYGQLDARFSPAKKTPLKSGLSGTSIGASSSTANGTSDEDTAPPTTRRSPRKVPLQKTSERSLSGPESVENASMHRVENYQELDSIMESEGFSMVSINALPCVRRQNITSGERAGGGLEDLLESAEEEPEAFEATAVVEESLKDQATSTSHATAQDGDIAMDGGSQPQTRSSAEANEAPHSAKSQRNVKVDTQTRSKERIDSSMFSNLTSSPPTHVLKNPSRADQSVQQTPSMECSSPSLPPLIPAIHPKQPQVLPSGEGTPKLAHVVRAGIALQGVVGKPDKLNSTSISPAKTRGKLRTDQQGLLKDLFGGFGRGTQRELRAGLRFGEELARRQRGSVERSLHEDDVFSDQTNQLVEYPILPTEQRQNDYALKVPGSAQLNYPHLTPHVTEQLPSPVSTQTAQADPDAMDWQTDTPVKVFTSSGEAQPQSEGGELEPADETVFSTYEEREARWQREREAVSRQIEVANSSQVIVIGDSSVVTNQRSWLKESTSLLGPNPRRHPPRPASRLEHRQDDIWQDVAAPVVPAAPQLHPLFDDVNKPRRGKIPSPWRKGDMNIPYSDEIEAEVDDATRQLAREEQEKSLQRQKAKAERERRRNRESWLDLSVLLGLKPSNSSDQVEPSSDNSPAVEQPKPLMPYEEETVVSASPFTSPARAQDRTPLATTTTELENHPEPQAPIETPSRYADSLASDGEWRKCHWQLLSDLYWATEPSKRAALFPESEKPPPRPTAKKHYKRTRSKAKKSSHHRASHSTGVPLASKSTNARRQPAPVHESDKPASYLPSFLPTSLLSYALGRFGVKEEPRAAPSRAPRQKTKERKSSFTNKLINRPSSVLGQWVENVTRRGLIIGPTEVEVITEFRDRLRAANLEAARDESIFNEVGNEVNAAKQKESRVGTDWDSEDPLYLWSEWYIARRLYAIIIAAKRREERREVEAANAALVEAEAKAELEARSEKDEPKKTRAQEGPRFQVVV